MRVIKYMEKYILTVREELGRIILIHLNFTNTNII